MSEWWWFFVNQLIKELYILRKHVQCYVPVFMGTRIKSARHALKIRENYGT